MNTLVKLAIYLILFIHLVVYLMYSIFLTHSVHSNLHVDHHLIIWVCPHTALGGSSYFHHKWQVDSTSWWVHAQLTSCPVPTFSHFGLLYTQDQLNILGRSPKWGTRHIPKQHATHLWRETTWQGLNFELGRAQMSEEFQAIFCFRTSLEGLCASKPGLSTSFGQPAQATLSWPFLSAHCVYSMSFAIWCSQPSRTMLIGFKLVGAWTWFFLPIPMSSWSTVVWKTPALPGGWFFPYSLAHAASSAASASASALCLCSVYTLIWAQRSLGCFVSTGGTQKTSKNSWGWSSGKANRKPLLSHNVPH